MSVSKIEFSPDAANQVRAVDSWWRLNRPSSADLFLDEFLATLEMLKLAPDAPRAYRHPRIPGLRRALMHRSSYHVYFTYHDDRALIFIHAVWHAKRGRGPRL